MVVLRRPDPALLGPMTKILTFAKTISTHNEAVQMTTNLIIAVPLPKVGHWMHPCCYAQAPPGTRLASTLIQFPAPENWDCTAPKIQSHPKLYFPTVELGLRSDNPPRVTV